MRNLLKFKTNLGIIMAATALFVAALACGSSTPEVRPAATDPPSEAEQPAAQLTEEESTEQVSPTEPAPPTETPKPLGSARSNPAPPGFEVSLGEITLVVGEVIRPATEIIMIGNMFNTEPEEGQEYILVEVSTRCDKGSDDTCNISGFEFSLIGSTGVVHDSEWLISGVDGLYEGGEFFGGATITGYLPFIIGQDEIDLILKYEELFVGEAYLALGQ